MIKKIAVAAIAAALVTLTTAAPAGAVVGGQPSTAPYSFMGSLQRLDSPRPDLHVCGVELIAPRWALTAGHCTRSAADVLGTPTSGHPADWKVRFGSTDVGSGGQLVRVARFTQLDNRYFVDDLALLRLARPVDLTPIAVADSPPPPGTPVRILGWGQTCTHFVPRCLPHRLHQADTFVQPERTCSAGAGNLCIGSPDGRVGPQNFDSGGPAITMEEGQWRLVGTVEGGGAAAPGIYTDVVPHRGWIDDRLSGRIALPEDSPPLSDALAGTVLFGGGCAGAIFRSAESRPGDPAMVLTAGHCVQPMPAPDKVVVDRPYRQYVYVKDRHGETVARAETTKVAYASMTGADVAVLPLDLTYAELAREHVHPFALAPRGPLPGQSLEVLSGASGRSWTCRARAIVPKLLEGGYRTFDAIGYRSAPGCNARVGEGPGHGDSGAPLVRPGSRSIVGLHATGNDEGGHCSPDNPCEIDGRGRPTSVEGRRYADQTAVLVPCLAAGSRVVLSRPGCEPTAAPEAP